jgi:hypothetical protein
MYLLHDLKGPKAIYSCVHKRPQAPLRTSVSMVLEQQEMLLYLLR